MLSPDTPQRVETEGCGEAACLSPVERGKAVAVAAPLHYRHSVKVMLKSGVNSTASDSQRETSPPSEKPRVMVQGEASPPSEKPRVMVQGEASAPSEKLSVVEQGEASSPVETPRVVVYSQTPQGPLNLCQEEWPTLEQAYVLERLELMRMATVRQRRIKPMVIVYPQLGGGAVKSSKGYSLPNAAALASLRWKAPQTTSGVAEAGQHSGTVPPTTTEGK
ncbi:uncharacterized protein LOC126153343 [Schistocerca cancellata]|uniref:uncharacterized protein LOC126153343 n=1 Tax=Schistocerca cancellata TaxID=274614 RepID=UPI00211924BB|nr:uncharacterized protein LOC126153343 [Schistocerca cancellata]